MRKISTKMKLGRAGTLRMTLLSVVMFMLVATSFAQTTWDGIDWTLGTPNTGVDAIIADYSEPIGNFTCRDLIVNADVTLEIDAGNWVSVERNMLNNGTIILKSPTDLGASGSLITMGAITNNGTMKAERKINEDQWHQMCSPLDAHVPVYDVFYMDHVLTYIEGYSGSIADDAWYWLETGETIAPGVGYLVASLSSYPENAGFMIEFEGTFRTGNVTVSPEHTYQGYNLIANPYPSSIDWNAGSGWTKTNLNPSFYIWNSPLYAEWDGAAGINGGVQYIPPMQAFFVQANAGGASVGMTNDVRVHNGVQFKSGKDEPVEMLRLQTSGNDLNDEIVLYKANDNAQGEKLLSWVEEVPQLYSMEEGKKLGINKLQDVESEFSVPLGFTCGLSGTYTISATELTFDDQIKIVLEDKNTGVYTLLESGTSYTFNYNSDDDDYELLLHFNSDISELENKIDVYSSGKDIYVNLTNLENGTVEVFNTLGQKLFDNELESVINTNLDTGIYILRVKTDTQEVTKRIFIK